MIGVIFDMDGVLVDSTEAHYEAWRKTGEWKGVPYSRAFFDRTYGMHNRQTIPKWLGRPAGDEELGAIANYKEATYRDVARTTVKPIAGVQSLIQSFRRAGFRLAVGSSGPRANIDLALEILGAASEFDAVSSGDDVKEGKPDPAIFLDAAHKLHLTAAQCVVIEDAPPGIEAAHRAGMRVIAVPTSRSADQLRAADWTAESLQQITSESVERLATR